MRLFNFQGAFYDRSEPVTPAFISSFCHPANSFCSRSITLAVSSYVVARRLFRLFPVLTDVKARTPHRIRGVDEQLNCWRVWSINVNCWSCPKPMLSIVWKFAIPWPSDWRLPSSSNINRVLYNGFWLRLFHLFATQALCQFTARPLQPVTRLYVNLNYQAIYFSRTAYASAANGDTIPQSVDVYHTDWNTTFRQFITKQTLVRDRSEPTAPAFISSFCHPATSFCSRSITLAVSSYVVARRLFRFFLVLTDVIVRTPHRIRRVVNQLFVI